MTQRETSSGDLLADRRFGYAQALLADGDPAAAADLLDQILDRVPGWTVAWMALASAEETRGDLERAALAYAKAAQTDVAGLFGARLHLARLHGTAEAMPSAYVAALFDDYAPRFDQHLVETLGYRGPALIVEALREGGAPACFGRALDLGCGTGLMGRAIRPQVDRLEGVDLSPAMVAGARRTGLYDDLQVADLGAALAQREANSSDLVLAADVFVYLGPLDAVFKAIARALRPGGTMAFTVQRTDGAPFRLGDDLRFAHSANYLAGTLQQAGFIDSVFKAVSTRREGGRDVPALVVVARTP